MRELLFRPPNGKAVLVDAFAPWCGPCRQIEPHLKECAKKYSDQLSVLKYNVESGNNNDLKVEMLLQGVMVSGLPTLVLYNDGRPIASHSGVITRVDLEKWLEKHLINKVGEFRPEVGMSTSANQVKWEGTAAKEKASSEVTASKKGFVSFASQFAADEYALTENRQPAEMHCVGGVCRRRLTRAPEKASSGVAGSKKGLVSFASHFGVDDYALTENHQSAGMQR